MSPARKISPRATFTASNRLGLPRDILWGRPVFKAPDLPNPRPRLEPLPFTAVRVTQPA